MRRLALVLGLLLASLSARAALSPTIWNRPTDAQQNWLGNLPPPSAAPDPTTAPVRPIDLNPAGAPCVLQAPGANGLPICASVAGFTVAGAPLQLSGTVLSFLWDNASLTLNGGGGLQVAAETGAITKGAGSTVTAFGTAPALSVLANATNGSAVPSFLGGGTAGQVLSVNAAGNAISWATASSAAVYADGVATGTIQLSSLSAALFTAGTIAWVNSVGDYFKLVQSSATPIPLVIVTASGKAGYVWERLAVGNVEWAARATWYVDPANSSAAASDENDGATSGAPLATFAELGRRLQNSTITASTVTVNLISNGANTDPLVLNNVQVSGGPFLKIVGQMTTVASGINITAAHNPAIPSNDHFEITTAASYTGWVGNYLLERTTGTPAWFWPYSDRGSGKLQISVPLNTASNAVQAISAAESLSVFSLPTFAGVVLNNVSPILFVSVQQTKLIGWSIVGGEIFEEIAGTSIDFQRDLFFPTAYPIQFITQDLNGYIGLDNSCLNMASITGIGAGISGPGFRVAGGLFLGNGATVFELAQVSPVVIGGAPQNTMTLGGVTLNVDHLSSLQKLGAMAYDLSAAPILVDLGSSVSIDNISGERNTSALVETQRMGSASAVSSTGFATWIGAATSSSTPYSVNGSNYTTAQLGIDTNQTMTAGGGIIGNAGWSGGLSGLGSNPNVVSLYDGTSQHAITAMANSSAVVTDGSGNMTTATVGGGLTLGGGTLGIGSGTANTVPFFNASGVFGEDPLLKYLGATHRFYLSSTNAPDTTMNGILNVQNEAGGESIYLYGSGSFRSELVADESRGSRASPTASLAGDVVFDFAPRGYDGSAYKLSMMYGIRVPTDATISTGHVAQTFWVSGDPTGGNGASAAQATWMIAGTNTRNVFLGEPNIATNATDGFVYLPASAGAPSGTPTYVFGGTQNQNRSPLEADNTDGRLYEYFGHWAPVGQDTTAMASGYLKNTTGTGVWSTSATVPWADVSGAPTFLLDPSGNGIVVRTSSGITTNRTLTSAGGTISVTNGSGVAGNPSVDLAQNGATTNQVLQWNGTSWAPSSLSASGVTSLAATDPVTVSASSGAVTIGTNFDNSTIVLVSHALAVGTVPAGQVSGLAAVATTGAYSSLTGTPTLYYQTIQAATSSLTQRPVWNAAFGLTAADNGGQNRTDLTVNLTTGISGGQAAIGDTAASGVLTLQSTANATRGYIKFGNVGGSNSVSIYDETNATLSIGDSSLSALGNGTKLQTYATVSGFSGIVSVNDAGVATDAYTGYIASLVKGSITGAHFGFIQRGAAFVGTPGFDEADSGLIQLVTTSSNAEININSAGVAGAGGDIVLTAGVVTNQIARFKANGLAYFPSEVLVNGATDIANSELVSFQTGNRDHVNLFVGGGASADSPDNSLVLVSQNSGTTIPAGRINGIWSTMRIEPNGYNGISTPTIFEADGLYIDNAPSVSGAVVTSGRYALHVAAGQSRFDGTMRLSGVPGLGAGTGIALLDSVGEVSSSGVLGAGVVVSDGAGAVTTESVPISSELVYYVEIPAATISTACHAIDCWLETSDKATFPATAIEFPAGFTPTHGTVSVNVISNTLTLGTVGVDMSQNGLVFGSGVSIGTSTTGTVSSSFSVSASSTDTFGVVIGPSIIATASGPLKLAIRFSLAQF